MKVDKYRVRNKKEVYEAYMKTVNKYFGDYRYTNKIRAFYKGVILGLELAESEEKDST